MKTNNRLSRINDEILKELSQIIRGELKDPRIGAMTSVIRVETTQDLKYCKVFVSVLGDEKEKENVSNVISDSSPVSDKVKSNFVLYNYFYNRKSNSTLKEKREIIYIVIISMVVINLFILSYVYDRKEKANAK